jgi:hypothetical protein
MANKALVRTQSTLRFVCAAQLERYALLRHILSFEWRKLKKAKGKIYVEFR